MICGKPTGFFPSPPVKLNLKRKRAMRLKDKMNKTDPLLDEPSENLRVLKRIKLDAI